MRALGIEVGDLQMLDFYYYRYRFTIQSCNYQVRYYGTTLCISTCVSRLLCMFKFNDCSKIPWNVHSNILHTESPLHSLLLLQPVVRITTVSTSRSQVQIVINSLSQLRESNLQHRPAPVTSPLTSYCVPATGLITLCVLSEVLHVCLLCDDFIAQEQLSQETYLQHYQAVCET